MGDNQTSLNQFFPDLRNRYKYTYTRLTLDRTPDSEKIWRYLDPGSSVYELPQTQPVRRPGTVPLPVPNASEHSPRRASKKPDPKYHKANIASTGFNQAQRVLEVSRIQARQENSQLEQILASDPPLGSTRYADSLASRPASKLAENVAPPGAIVEDDDAIPPPKNTYGRVSGYCGFVPGLRDKGKGMAASTFSQMEFKDRQRVPVPEKSRVEVKGNLF